MPYKMTNTPPLLAFLAVIYVRQSFETCTINQWCRPLTNVSASEYKFVVQTSTKRMNWFDALQLCRNEGGGAELFSLESATEREWLRTQLGSSVPKIGVLEENEDGELLWFVNAHLYLYSDGLTWATGFPIDESVNREIRGASLSIRRTIPVKNCLSNNNGVEAECFAISITRQSNGASEGDKANMMLVDVPCIAARAFGAICKRFRDLKPPSTSASTSKYKFVLSEWIRSPTDGTVYYRILNLQNECYLRASWYCARLLCMRHEASLTDIEDNEEYEWLVDHIAESFIMERISGGTDYFVDLHRLFYNTSTWTWGDPQKNRSFIDYLPHKVSQNPCKQKLCASIRYAIGSNETIGLGEMYCGGNTLQARAICKKLLPLQSTAVQSTGTFPSHKLLMSLMFILSLLMLVFLSFCVVRSFNARKLVRHSRRFAAHSETSKPQCKATSTSYYPILPPGPLSGCSEGEIERTTLPIQNQTDGLNSQCSQNVDAIESSDHKAQGTFVCAHKMCQKQSLSNDILVHSINNSDIYEYAPTFK